MEYIVYDDLYRGLRDLRKKGGPLGRAGKTVEEIIGRIALKEPDPFRGVGKTHYGEKRIQKCRKYDLSGAARLITVEHDQVCTLLYAGDHNASEKWLESHRGWQLAVDKTNKIDEVEVSPNGINEESRITGESNFSYGKLWQKLPTDWFDLLTENLPDVILSQLKHFESIDSEKHFAQVCSSIDDSEKQGAIYDVFTLLRQGDITAAIRRIELFLEALTKVDDASPEKIEAIVDGHKLKVISVDSPAYKELFDHFISTANYKDWMLFMHPDQDSIASASFHGSAKLTGVSGSGKTCIIVKRAIHLAQKYTEGEILVLTLNRPLAGLINELINTCAIGDISDRITVKPFFELCQQLLHGFEPEKDRLYDDQTWKSKEHIDEVWREFYRCELNYDFAKVLLPVHDSLISRGINSEKYIHEEFDWIRSVVAKEDRQDYLEILRKGRSYSLDQNFRSCLIDGLSAWERKMVAVGVTDHLGIATALYQYRQKLSPHYRCVLVDECQDFGTLELELIRSLVPKTENDLFFAGDAAQHVSWKHQSLNQAGIYVPGPRSLKIRQNYRNSRDILLAAHRMLSANITEEMRETEDFEILNPEFANFEGSIPSYLEANDLESEIGFGIAFLEQEVDLALDRKGCLVICGFSLFEIQHFGKRLDIPVLDGTTSLDDGHIFLADLEQTKGFEFDTVCIINLSKDVIPNSSIPEKEQFRDLARLYVAMTRAKTQLILSYSMERSVFFNFLSSSDDQMILTAKWPEFVENDVKKVGVPTRLEQLRKDNIDILDISLMTGSQFLYTESAIGLSRELVRKIRELIPGRRTQRNGHAVKWKDIGSAAADVQNSPFSKKEFGDRLADEFLSLTDSLGL